MNHHTKKVRMVIGWELKEFASKKNKSKHTYK
jgi:hypothetical protein